MYECVWMYVLYVCMYLMHVMYVCIMYVYTYCIYMYVRTCMNICTRFYACMYVCIYVCMYIYYVCMYVWLLSNSDLNSTIYFSSCHVRKLAVLGFIVVLTMLTIHHSFIPYSKRNSFKMYMTWRKIDCTAQITIRQ